MFGRHFVCINALKQIALGGTAREDCRAALASCQGSLGGRQIELSLRLRPAMELQASPSEDWRYLPIKVGRVGSRKRADKHQAGEPIELIDVRTPVEFREVHCPFARNIPLSDLDPKAVLAARNGNADTPLYLICRSGSRGKQACEKFHAAGFTQVVNVEGGTLAWADSGLPVNRGKKAISLERQVRIAAGSLVFVGSLLAWFIHPAFLIVPAFVGAGLVFAGVTDTCGMALLLARMPWNQVRCETGSETNNETNSGSTCCA